MTVRRRLQTPSRPTRFALIGLACAAIVAALTVVVAPPAQAACHHFSVKATPATVPEGATVNVTVSRDGAVGPSNIDVSTVDGTAKAGSDYTALRQTVKFTTETSQTFEVKTIDDNQQEPAETFRVHLANPGGCTVNPNFVVDPDAVVTIDDNDKTPATATTVAGHAPTTSSRATATTAGPTAATSTVIGPTSTGAAVATTSPRTVPPSTGVEHVKAAAPGTKHNSDGSWGLTAAVAVVMLLAAGAGTVVILRRRARTTRTR
jgi:hypothetical protein